ncbi:MAG: nitronate monooxygenase [Pseudomonadota bacterium]
MSLSELFGIEHPLVQAPLAGVQDSALAIAVSEAGGLGSLPCALLSLDKLREELGTLQARLQRRYNLNFFCHESPQPDSAREAHWRTALAPYYRELGLDPAAALAAPLRQPFNDACADLVEQFRPAVVSFHFGLPAPELLARVRASGARIVANATTLAEGRWLAARGVDAIIAQGWEAGGHRGIFLSDDLSTQVGTIALLRQLVLELDVPIIAAGGIGDAAGVAAAMALGAAGVQVGTAYLLCPEARTSAPHRAALASAAAQHTALTNLFTGRPARGIVNRLMRDFGPINAIAPAFPLASAALAPLRAKSEALGSGDFSPLWAGQNASGCRAIPAAALTAELVKGFDKKKAPAGAPSSTSAHA